jgi:hypothetical protein
MTTKERKELEEIKRMTKCGIFMTREFYKNYEGENVVEISFHFSEKALKKKYWSAFFFSVKNLFKFFL